MAGAAAAATPPEFVCPISGELMADPVIVPSGETFERGCVEACVALGFTPAALLPSVDLAASPPPALIPNANLRKAISSYCHRVGLPRPLAVSPEEARSIVRRLMAVREPGRAGGVNGERFESSSSSSPEFAALGLTLEEAVLVRLLDDEPSRQEGALEALKQMLRGGENGVRRALCTPRLLDGLRRLMGSGHEGVSVSAAACVVNLSLEPANRVQLVRAELVPVLVGLLAAASPELRDHAAGAVYSLSIEERNRIPIGVLGAVPPLLRLLASAADGDRARRDAGMALYYLSLDEMNRSRLARSAGADAAAAAPWMDDVSVMSEAMAMPQFPRRLVEHAHAHAHGAPPRSNTTALDRLRQAPNG
uniref:RING-type E3 ubiquitin transferase n=1 Tax=Oryza glumipatula TaxID=40148 RepID=A0A0E0A7B5_9ORYZ